jgi:hypothetical protein
MFSRANPTGWAPGDVLSAAQINKIDLDQSRAVDGTGGSAGTPYAPITSIDIAGSGIRTTGTGDAAWLQVPSRALDRLVETDAIFWNDAGTHGSWSIQHVVLLGIDSALLVAPQSDTSHANSGTVAIRIRPPCNGATLNSLTVTAGTFVFGTPASFSPGTYQVWDYNPFNQTRTALSAVVNDGTIIYGGASTSTLVPLTAPHVVDTSAHIYALVIQNAYTTGGGVELAIDAVVGHWTITAVQPV